MDYKSYVGNPKHYELIGQTVFELLLKCGLKREHTLLDIGCGSLRVGKHIINYLNDERYYGIEPNRWLINQAIDVNPELMKKGYMIWGNANFDLSEVNEKFDFILANSIFIHASMDQIEKCVYEVKEVLKPKGKFLFNYIEGNDNLKSEWSYPSAVTYSKSYIEILLASLDFSFEYLDVKYPGKQKFILAIRS